VPLRPFEIKTCFSGWVSEPDATGRVPPYRLAGAASKTPFGKIRSLNSRAHSAAETGLRDMAVKSDVSKSLVSTVLCGNLCASRPTAELAEAIRKTNRQHRSQPPKTTYVL